jgi:hypothetical protein
LKKFLDFDEFLRGLGFELKYGIGRNLRGPFFKWI